MVLKNLSVSSSQLLGDTWKRSREQTTTTAAESSLALLREIRVHTGTPLAVERRFMNPQACTGPVGGNILGSQLYPANLYFNISTDRARFEAEVGKSIDRINIISI